MTKIIEPMNATEYQKEVTKTAVYTNPFYPYFALVEEVGELYGKFARMFRGDKEVPTEEQMKKEMGDVMWNVAEICTLRGWDLSEIMQINPDKLAARQEANTLEGSGDER